MNSFYWSQEQGHRRNGDEKMVASAQGTCLETFEKEKQVVSWKVSTCKEEAVASLSMDQSRDTSGRHSPHPACSTGLTEVSVREWLWNNFANCKVQCTTHAS